MSSEIIEQILKIIPHQPPFRFIDNLTHVDEETVTGNYLFKKNEYFYEGHFPDKHITPGVILSETMAQIGLIPLGFANYITENPGHQIDAITPLFTNANVKFLKPVFPETRVHVEAKKIYFRLNRIKAKIKLFKENGEVCCSGELAGVFQESNEETF